MKNIELLSPVGKAESAYAAIANGADAIYLGGMKFGARAFADNFDLDELSEILKYAHLYHVRVFVTLNTIIYQSEMEDCMKYVKMLYDLHIDALIVQDLGLMYLIRSQFPDFEVHASTQMHLYNRDALIFLQQQGVKRAVLARECSIEKIASFQDIDIEKEVFVHGALCISYSGQCLFSQVNNQRSGNRGKCAQGCRMPYRLLREQQLIQEQAYLLSPKDLNTLDHVPALVEAGIDSFKIEGRMKSPEYVGYTTHLYRQAIDQNAQVDEISLNQLKVLFNRRYTAGHLFHEQGSDLINQERPNHIGIPLGQVTKVMQDRFQVKLQASLNQGDGIRLIQKEDVGFVVNWIYKEGLLVNHGNVGDVIELERTNFVEAGAQVVKTKDQQWEKEIRNAYESSGRKISLYAELILEANEYAVLKIRDNFANKIEYKYSELVQIAKTRALKDEDIIKQLRKTKDTIYNFEHVEVKHDGNIFMPVSQINELRREALTQFASKVLDHYPRETIPFSVRKIEKTPIEYGYHVNVMSEEQLNVCLEFPFLSIFVEERELYEKYKHHAQVKFSSTNIYDGNYEDVSLSGELGGLKAGMHLDSSFNINNAYGLEYMLQLGAKCVCLSQELDDTQIREVMKTYLERDQDGANIELVVYGKTKLMSSNYCVVNHSLLDNNRKNCSLCKKKHYYLEDGKSQHFFLRGDDRCTMHMYHSEVQDTSKQISMYRDMGIQQFRLQFRDESAKETKEIIRKFQI